MKNMLDWNDVKLFLGVARNGGLTTTSRITGISPATLGRRMLALERETDAQLFIREQRGYRLTREGEQLFVYAEQLERSAQSIERWRETHSQRGRVRVSTGHWMGHFLAKHIHRLCAENDDFTLELVTDPKKVDIGRRHADIGIRNRRPEEQWLARRRVGVVNFAPFCANTCTALTNTKWIAYTDDMSMLPSAQWLENCHGDEILMRCSDPRLILDLACAGAGQVVLPCFIGDSEPGLKRSGTVINELRHEQWLVLHHEDRHLKKISSVNERIVNVIVEHRPLFEG